MPEHDRTVDANYQFDRMHTTMHDMLKSIVTLYMRVELLAAIMRSQIRCPQNLPCPVCNVTIDRSS